MSYIRVCEDVGTKPVELPAEDDDTLPVETLQAQFPHAIGLKYLPDPNSDIFRGIRCTGGKLKPPKEGWEDITFVCTYPPDYKRKVDDSTSNGAPAAKKHAGPREVKCADLIILGLDWKTTEDSLKKYFEEKFGPLLMALVKTDPYTKRSKGFGFIRFSKYEDQVKALSARKHEIDGRWVTLKPPYAKDGVESSLPSKVFLSRLQANVTNEEIKEYFSKYGEVADVFCPKTPFRGFAFLTFVSPDSADQAVEEEPHIIKGCSVGVVHANDQKQPSYGEMSGGRGGYRGGIGGRGKPPSRGRGGYSAPSRYSSSYGGSRGSSYRGGYDNYDDDYDSYGNGAPPREEISHILAAALKNPSTINTLLNTLDRKSSGPPPSNDYSSSRDYDRDYSAPPSSYDKDYSYSDKPYNPYPKVSKDKGSYGGASSKYGGSGSSRY